MSQTQQIVQRIATKAVIVNEDGKVLILREAGSYNEGTQSGRYQLPGGRLEAGEAVADGLTREVREETGLQIQIGKPIFVGEWTPVIKGVTTQIVGIFFICKLTGGEVTLSEEHDSFSWIGPDEVSTFDISTPDNKVVKEYFSR